MKIKVSFIKKIIIAQIRIYTYVTINLYCYLISATVYFLPTNNNSSLIGENIEFTIPINNVHSLEYFAKKFQVGIRNILAANPDIDLYLPDSNKCLIIPKQLILPNTLRSGIIINSAEMRLFYYDPNKSNTVIIFPISIGTADHATPSHWITSIKYKKKTYLDSNR